MLARKPANHWYYKKKSANPVKSRLADLVEVRGVEPIGKNPISIGIPSFLIFRLQICLQNLSKIIVDCVVDLLPFLEHCVLVN